MKRLLGVILIVFTIIGLSACGKAEDMSGTYFFKRTLAPPDNIQYEDVGTLTLVKASDDGMKYNATETVPGRGIQKTGELLLNDKSYLDLTLNDQEEQFYDEDDLMAIDITNLKGVEYDFQKGVLTLGGELEFYREDTDEGKKLMKVWNGTSSKAESEEATIPTAENLFQKSCASCHGGDLSGGVAPDISSIGSSLSAEEIEAIIVDGKGVMPPGILVGDDAKMVAEWLSEMK